MERSDPERSISKLNPPTVNTYFQPEKCVHYSEEGSNAVALRREKTSVKSKLLPPPSTNEHFLFHEGQRKYFECLLKNTFVYPERPQGQMNFYTFEKKKMEVEHPSIFEFRLSSVAGVLKPIPAVFG